MSRKTPDTPPEQTSMVRAMALPIALFVGAIVLALVIGWIRMGGSDVGASSPAPKNGRILSAATMQKFRTKWDQVGVAMGPPDAPVVVREFADYQCPACGAFEPTAERIRQTYVKSGKVRFIFFDFPLQMHEHAHEAAAAARCAGRQDAYWPFHKRLYANQRTWAEQADPTNTFLNYAVESGINAQRLRRCLVQGAANPIIARSVDIAKKIGVRATPTILVGAHMFTGAASFKTLSKFIENKLAAAKSR